MSHRKERKRGREKRRRDDFKEALEHLHDSLLQHDEIFRQEAERRASIAAPSVVHTARTMAGSQEYLAFTRVEIINQAIFTIGEAVTLNKTLKVPQSELMAPSEDESQIATTQHPSQDTPEEAKTSPQESSVPMLDQAYPSAIHEPSIGFPLLGPSVATLMMDQVVGIPTATPPHHNGEGDVLPREDAASPFALKTDNQRMVYQAAMGQQQESNRTALHNMHSRQHHAQRNQILLDTAALVKQAVARYQLSTSPWHDNALRVSPPSQQGLMERSLVVPSPTRSSITKNQRKRARSQGNMNNAVTRNGNIL